MPDDPMPAAVENSEIRLKSLAPSYAENRHGVYVAALVRALREQDDVRNIALTGAYGTGKSSVLRQLTAMREFRDRVLELSLSTLGVAPEKPQGGPDSSPAAWTTTNLIQKEIVKQILYRDAPEKTRGSRFRRLSRFGWRPEIGIALGLGALLFVLLWLVGLAAPLIRVLGPDPALGWLVLANMALLAALAGIIYILRWITHNRVFLEKLSAGPATVSLSATSSSYFDQYMDEIVYHFEESGRDIVIFEDIDRFENVHIFETLRALNTLLNGSEQVRRRRRISLPGQAKERKRPDIKFIYALRDSVFEKLGDSTDSVADAEGIGGQNEAGTGEPGVRDHADDEVRRANRTKFFDIVIPIVPFITHRNARDLMLDAMIGTDVSRELINVVARFVADMRLITDMRNEYDIYANRLLGTRNQVPGLDADRLFALVVYKCVHMADFEAIRFGRSDLDALHDAWRNIVADSLADAYERLRTAAKRLALDAVTASRAQALGDRAHQVFNALTGDGRQVSSFYIDVDGQRYGEVRSHKCWERIVGAPGPSVITLGNSESGLRHSLTRDRFQTLLGQELDPTAWQEFDRAAELLSQQSAQDDIAFLRHHGWGEIHDLPKYRLRSAGGEGESFAGATQRILRSRLARALVASGYINDYFALYVSIYYGEHLRPQAINYVVHALDRGIADFHYLLDADDVEAIIGDKGIDIFRDRAAYNISIFDHLLSERPNEAKMIVNQVAALDADDVKFGEAYLKGGAQRVHFVQLLAPLIPEAILGFVSEAPPEILPALIDAALDYAGASIGETENDRLITDHYAHFPSITEPPNASSGINLHKPQTIDAIAKLGILLPDTTPLTKAARSRVLELGAYELNAINVEDLTGQPSLALDVIRSESPAVYRVVLDRAGEYLELVASRDEALTINEPDQFISILNEAQEAGVHGEHLTQFVERASANCHVDDVTEVPEQVWPTLAAAKLMAPSMQNLLAYLAHVGDLDDDNVGSLLSDVEALDSSVPVSDEEAAQLVVAFIGAARAIPSPARRVALAKSLGITAPISPAAVAVEGGDIVSLMIEAGLLADNEDTFSSKLMVDWPTRESALAVSKNAATFLTPASLPPGELADFFPSAKVPMQQKVAVLVELASFFPDASLDGIRAAATFAVDSGEDLSFGVIDQLRLSGVPDAKIVALLGNSTSVSLDELRVELRALGAPYPLIADPGSARPLVPDDDTHRLLLERLKNGSIVSNHRPERGKRRVSLRRL